VWIEPTVALTYATLRATFGPDTARTHQYTVEIAHVDTARQNEMVQSNGPDYNRSWLVVVVALVVVFAAAPARAGGADWLAMRRNLNARCGGKSSVRNTASALYVAIGDSPPGAGAVSPSRSQRYVGLIAQHFRQSTGARVRVSQSEHLRYSARGMIGAAALPPLRRLPDDGRDRVPPTCQGLRSGMHAPPASLRRLHMTPPCPPTHVAGSALLLHPYAAGTQRASGPTRSALAGRPRASMSPASTPSIPAPGCCYALNRVKQPTLSTSTIAATGWRHPRSCPHRSGGVMPTTGRTG
jgi:hypothetical protein